jgi:RimJ/RimL family protein N-acetyltransferase
MKGERTQPAGCRDGLVSIGRLSPGDRDAVLEVFDGLSERSRRLRYHGPKPRLPEREVDDLVDVGRCGREAVAAVDAVSGNVVGIARFVRDHQDRGTAEIAFEVVDDCQSSGVGRRLVAELSLLAAREGVSRFRASILAGNESALELLRRAGVVVESVYDGCAYVLFVELYPLDRAA